MKILSVYNMKGGVGKTASAVNLSYLCAESGKKTLLWDLDPQGAASFYFRVKPKIKGGAKKLLKKRDLDDHIKGSDFENLDVLPADTSFRNIDITLDGMKKSQKRLKDALKELDDEYDAVFLDCPPGITLLSDNIFAASDFVLVPMIPTTLSMRTYRQMEEHFASSGHKHKKLLPFFSMVDRRKKMHKDLMDSLVSEQPVLEHLVPLLSDIERMGMERQPVPVSKKRSVAARAYRELWSEVAEKIGLE